MSAITLQSFEESLSEVFPVVTGFEPEQRYALLPITAHLLAHVSVDELLVRIRAVLPEDVKIVSVDGRLARLGSDGYGCGADRVMITVSSETWPAVEEGAMIPKLDILFWNNPPTDQDRPAEIKLYALAFGGHYEIPIDKNAFTISIPRERETDGQCVIEVRPK